VDTESLLAPAGRLPLSGPGGGGPSDRHGARTTRLDPAALAAAGVTPWPLVLASLEQLGPWGIQALRLGLLSLLCESIRAMARPGATASHVTRIREYVEALAHLPWEPR
jgi:hypothetical protein